MFSEFLSRLIGFTLLAFLADINADKYIVINPSAIDKMHPSILTPNNIPFIPSNRYCPNITPTIFSTMYIAKSPDSIPNWHSGLIQDT